MTLDIPEQFVGSLSTHAYETDGFEHLRHAKVMMVDDEPINIEVLQVFLEEAGYERFIYTNDPSEAMDLLSSHLPDVLLLDLMMPKVTGFDILTGMRADPKLRHIPVVVLTSSTDAETKLKALELGATDFLAKPVDSSELALRLRNTLTAKAYQDRLTYRDPLTGLPNRKLLIDYLDWTLRQAARHGRMGALLHVGIDRFKKINEALGPALADEFLKAVAARMEQSIRVTDSVARAADGHPPPRLSRVGGDEFMVLLVEIDKVESAGRVAQRLLDSLSAPIDVAGHELVAACSIGITVFPADGDERDILLKHAGVAMQFAKQQGGSVYRFYSRDLNSRSLHYLDLQSDLRKALDREELRLFYQPKIDTRTGQLVGAEALARWQHPERGFVGPDQFIPLAEETGLIVPLGTWVLSEVCNKIKGWQSRGLNPPRVSVNVSGRQFREQNFLSSVRDIIDHVGVDAKHLTLELTESMLMGNAQANIQVLQQLKAMGFKLSIDDFGTGYSSLSYLKRFPIDELKIDRSFLADIGAENDNDSAAIVVAIIALAHSLGLSVVAEGVETAQQLAFLNTRDCEECQGYLFSRPIPVDQFTALLENKAEFEAKCRSLGTG